MKRIIRLGFSAPLVLSVFVVSCSGSVSGSVSASATPSTQTSNENLAPGQERVVIPVKGMTCGGCETAIKIALKKLDGVLAVHADHRNGTVTVTHEKDKVTVERIVEAIDKTGFKASVPGKDPVSTANPAAEAVGLVSLADSLQPLQDRFDELRGRPHFVALLSPT